LKYNPKISILVPVRNDAAMIPNCLADIDNQSLTDYELVVVDDGSTDQTPLLLEKACQDDSRIRMIRTEPQGIVSALNTGLTECKGQYIARMDADDRMHKTRLGKQLELMQKDPELELIGCRVEGFTEKGLLPESAVHYHSWNNSLISHQQIETDLFAESPIVHPTFFAKKDLLNKIGGYSENPWAEDYDLILRAYGKCAKFGKHPDILVQKYHAPGRLSRLDPMYKRPAMFEAKVHYLLEFGLLKKNQGVLIAGTGPTGRQAAQSFENRGVRLLGFVDNRPGPPNRQVKGLPAWGFKKLPPLEFINKFRNNLIVLGIGDATGQKLFADFLRKSDFIENKDFVV